jgi:site-specific recombinase XerD
LPWYRFISAEHPHLWLFNGKEPDGRYSVRGLSWVMRETLKKTSIKKEVNLHSLRHAPTRLIYSKKA